jgi:hypothetical protein
MKRLILLAAWFALIIWVMFGTSLGVAAQETLVFEKPSLNAQILDVRATYRSQLETYRNAERQYLITKEQFFKLNTLASLEAAVKATKEAMLARDQVLYSYLTLVRLYLIDATGVNLTQKEPTLAELEVVLQALEAHTQTVSAANDRYQISQASQEFLTLGPRIEAVAYQTTTILSIGELQTIYDKSLSLDQEITASLSGITDVRNAERQRALTEIKRELNEVQTSFSEVNLMVEKENQKFNRAFYNRVTQNLGTVYVGLSQTLTHMAEVLKL